MPLSDAQTEQDPKAERKASTCDAARLRPADAKASTWYDEGRWTEGGCGGIEAIDPLEAANGEGLARFAAATAAPRARFAIGGGNFEGSIPEDAGVWKECGAH